MTGPLPTLFTVQVVTFAGLVGLMLAEMRHSRANERVLTARGAIRPDGDVWAWMAALYPLSFVLMTSEGLWRTAEDGGGHGASWYVAGLGIFVAGKGLKYWAIRTLADRWSFRVWIVPGAALIRTGPYRYVDHPNYLGVIGELVGTAMMMRAAITGPLMCVAFGVVLWGRVRFEARMLRTLALAPE